MSRAPQSQGPFAALRVLDFWWFELARLCITIGTQMQGVAIAWQVYDITKNPLDLGYVGLAQFLPMLLLTLVAGHVADRFDRRKVLLAYYVAMLLGALMLLGFTKFSLVSALGLWPVYAVLAWLGAARAFAGPAAQALLPNLVPKEVFSNAVTWHSAAWQVSTILGPALGGLVFSTDGGALRVYGAFACLAVLSFFVTLLIKTKGDQLEAKGVSVERLLAGVRYVANHPILLGAISLDLFAVLLGGAVALLPIFARDILMIGPSGLGLLRSAPAFGAGLMALVLAFYPLKEQVGKTMLGCVAMFGVATCVFGVSSHFYLSFFALFIAGASDLVSVVIRQTLVQIKTPPDMRGRVSAVNQVFIGASNELGEFESGLTAAWFGARAATILGGMGTIGVVLLWARLFPDLVKTETLD